MVRPGGKKSLQNNISDKEANIFVWIMIIRIEEFIGNKN